MITRRGPSWIKRAAAISSLIIAGATPPAAGSSCLQDVEPYARGPATAVVAIEGRSTVAAATGGVVEILDMSGPAPVALGSVQVDGFVTGMAVDGDIAWVVAEPPALTAMDLADPSAPTVLASRRLASSSPFVAADGARVAIAVGGDIVVLDATDPAHLVPAAVLDRPPALTVAGFDLADDLLYSGLYDTWTLEIWNVGGPGPPVRISELPLSSPPSGRVIVDGGVAAVEAYGVLLVDVTDASDPRECATVGDHLEDVAGQIDMAGGRLAYTTSVSGELWIQSVGDPARPVPVYRGGRFTASHGVAVVGLGAVVANGADGVWTASDPSAPVLDTFGGVRSVAYEGDTVVLGDDGGSFGILSRNPGTGGLDLEGAMVLEEGPWVVWAQDVKVALSGGLAVAAHLDTVSVVDLAPPDGPKVVARVPADGLAVDVDLDGRTAYVLTGSELAVVDVSAPAVATRLGGVPHGLGSARDLAVGNGWAALVGVYSGAPGRLTMVDLDDPHAPGIAATVGLESQAHGVAVQGDVLVLAAGDAGLLMVDVTRPFEPEIRNAFAVGDTAPAYRVWLDGDVAWVGGGTTATCPLRRVDIADPSDPVDLGCVDGWSADDMAFAGDRVAVARGPAGIAVAARTCLPVAAGRTGNHE